jgi:hypothetical protein
MNINFLGDVRDAESPLRAAARSACVELDLPISDAAIDLADKVTDYMIEAVDEATSDDLESGLEMAVNLSGDWESGSGVISGYTSTQCQQWADLGCWQVDLLEDHCVPVDLSTAERIGRELSIVAQTIASAVAEAITELAEAHAGV